LALKAGRLEAAPGTGRAHKLQLEKAIGRVELQKRGPPRKKKKPSKTKDGID